jgi:hypothetical protein
MAVSHDLTQFLPNAMKERVGSSSKPHGTAAPIDPLPCLLMVISWLDVRQHHSFRTDALYSLSSQIWTQPESSCLLRSSGRFVPSVDRYLHPQQTAERKHRFNRGGGCPNVGDTMCYCFTKHWSEAHVRPIAVWLENPRAVEGQSVQSKRRCLLCQIVPN